MWRRRASRRRRRSRKAAIRRRPVHRLPTTAAAGIYETIDVRVPDIGDFKDVPVIEVLVKAGDTVKAEDPLITLESDKATMDVPSPVAGTIAELKVKVGDKVAEGSAHPDAVDRRGRTAARAVARRRQRAAPSTVAAPAAAFVCRAAPTSSARCSCSAPDPAATRRRSAPPISA